MSKIAQNHKKEDRVIVIAHAEGADSILGMAEKSANNMWFLQLQSWIWMMKKILVVTV